MRAPRSLWFQLFAATRLQSGSNALLVACGAGQLDAVKFLVREKLVTDLWAPSSVRWRARARVCCRRRSNRSLSLLCQRKETAMSQACKAGHLHIARWLLDATGTAALNERVRVSFLCRCQGGGSVSVRVLVGSEGHEPTRGRGVCQPVAHVSVAHRGRGLASGR